MRVYLDSIGCRLNQSEIEKIGRDFFACGHDIVSDPSHADVAIVNTCTVTAAAAADSRKTIRRIAKAGCENIVGTGCYATIDPKTVADLPSVKHVVSNEKKDNLLTHVLSEGEMEDIGSPRRIILPGKRKRTRAFIKIQDGCENHCTFCITRIARGGIRSQSEKSILSECTIAVDSGVKELVLTGVNLGSWGKDIGEKRLNALVLNIHEHFPGVRIRLSSIEPWDVNPELIELFDIPEFCPHLHLPLQSGSEEILRMMGRKMTARSYRELVSQIRQKSLDIAITSDLMVGFPGETEDLHEESKSFIEEIMLADGHVFRYSPRKGTPAERYPDKVRNLIKKQRSEQIRNLIHQSKSNYFNRFLGRNLSVLWEKVSVLEDGYLLEGLSDNYIKVETNHTSDLYNHISTVKIIKITDNAAVGRIIQ